MTKLNGHKSSAELEQEVDAQRDRVEARIGAIKERLSPGQLIDEALSYSKNGGAHFASNLGQQLTANPVPAALVGIGLAWLFGSSIERPDGASAERWDSANDDSDFPYARASSLQRVDHAQDEAGQWWSEFKSDTGHIFRAQANEQGHRAGHFIDATGKKFGGFIDAAGHRVRRIHDESGNLMDAASGWASHGWRDLRRNVGQQVHAAAQGASSLMSQGKDLGGNLGGQMASQSAVVSRQISALFEQQPLIAGALAFAAGAALGASLPHTDQEDALVGEQADRLRGQAGDAAGSLYEKGKEQVGGAYDKAAKTTQDIYDEAKGRVADAVSQNGADRTH